jgi:hypothetical protein
MAENILTDGPGGKGLRVGVRFGAALAKAADVT